MYEGVENQLEGGEYCMCTFECDLEQPCKTSLLHCAMQFAYGSGAYQRHLLDRAHDAGRSRDRFGQGAGEAARVKDGQRGCGGRRRPLMVMVLQMLVLGRTTLALLLLLAVLAAVVPALGGGLGRGGCGGGAAAARCRPQIGREQDRARTGRRRVQCGGQVGVGACRRIDRHVQTGER